MGSNSSSQSENACCGGCNRYSFKKQKERLLSQIVKYKNNVGKSIDQFKEKQHKLNKRDFDSIKSNASNFLKQNKETSARKELQDYFYQQKAPKIIIRQLDFLQKKQRMLESLKTKVQTQPKPKKALDKKNLILENYNSLDQLKKMEFNVNEDQLSGDSDDIQGYIDKIIQDLRIKLFPPKPQTPKIKKQEQIPKQKAIIKKPSRSQNRQRFLKNLFRKQRNGHPKFRKLNDKQIIFYQQKIGIQLQDCQKVLYKRQQESRLLNQPKKSKTYIDQGSGIIHEINVNQISSVSNSSNQKKDSYMKLSSYKQNKRQSYYEDNSRQKGYYLNLQGYTQFKMQQFLQCDWSMVEVLDLTQCNIDNNKWKLFVKSFKTCLPHLKVLYIRLNKISQISFADLQSIKSIKYISFGWWDSSNQISTHSMNQILKFKAKNQSNLIQCPIN